VPSDKQLETYKEDYLTNSVIRKEISQGYSSVNYYEERQKAAIDHVKITHDYRSECREKYSEFKKNFDYEMRLLHTGVKVKNSENPINASRILLIKDPKKALEVLEGTTKFDAQINGKPVDLLNHVIPAFFARAEYLSQQGKEFIYNAMDHFHYGEYFQSARFIGDNFREDVLLYSQQQVVRIGEEHADLDLANIRQQTAILKQQLG
jgi:hypothetical protein